jgi:hypothetical protein
MSITTIQSTDYPSDSRTVINDNFTDLDTTKADLASPTFTGTPTLPTGTVAVTQSASNNSTKVATTAYVDTQVATRGTNFSTTQVFTGNAPTTTFTDLDLSSVIGVTQKVVMLRIYNGGGSSYEFSFRRNGATGEGASDSDIEGVFHVRIPTLSYSYVITVTDTAGVVEWTCTNGSNPDVTIYVEAYW